MADKSLSLPEPTYTVPSNGRVLTMSYGMFSDITRLVGDPENLTAILVTDPMARDLVLRRLFTDNSKSVDKIEELVDSFEIDILPTELDGILAWVADHVSYFLVSTGRSLGQMIQRYQPAEPTTSQSSQS